MKLKLLFTTCGENIYCTWSIHSSVGTELIEGKGGEVGGQHSNISFPL